MAQTGRMLWPGVSTRPTATGIVALGAGLLGWAVVVGAGPGKDNVIKRPSRGHREGFLLEQPDEDNRCQTTVAGPLGGSPTRAAG